MEANFPVSFGQWKNRNPVVSLCELWYFVKHFELLYLSCVSKKKQS